MKKMKKRIYRLAAFWISLIMLTGQISAVYAADRAVMIQTSGAGAPAAGEGDAAAVGVSGLRVTDVDVPVPGMPLDTAASVTSAEGEQWDIPVMWVDDEGAIAEEIAEDRLYFPVLVFFVPEGYSVLDGDSETGAFPVCVDDSLTELFGEDLLTVFLAEYQITLIFPGSADLQAVLSRLAGMSDPIHPQGAGSTAALKAIPAPAGSQAETAGGAGGGTVDPDTGQFDTYESPDELVYIFCSSEAVMRLGEDQLAVLLDLIINKLQPQAVNLLAASFLTFQAGMDTGQLGREIGLYIYYGQGDLDGTPEHEETVEDAVAYIWAQYDRTDEETIVFKYLLAVDAASFCFVNDYGQAVLDLENKDKIVLLENTLVHEMMHAFTYDYLRTGMSGAVHPEELFVDEGLSGEEKEKAIERQAELYKATVFPAWFIEGLGSAVENVYQYRHDTFQLLRYDRDLSGLTAGFSEEGILKAYLTEIFPDDSENSLMTYDLENAGQNEDSLGEDLSNTPAKYVTGYLACLYLAGLTAYDWKDEKTYAAIGENMKSGTYLYGLNSIIERLHEGETLDSLIRTVSGGRYANTDDFEKKFIKGVSTGSGADQVWQGDDDSLLFCSDFLNYMLSIDNNESFTNYANGSVLFEFDRDYELPLDLTKEVIFNNLYTFVESNTAVESTVPNATALESGGKSRGGWEEWMNAASAPGNDAGEPLMPAAQAAKQSERQTVRQAEVQTAGQTEGQAAGQTEEQAAGQTEEQAAGQTGGQAAGQAEAQAAGKAEGQVAAEPFPAAQPAEDAADVEAAEMNPQEPSPTAQPAADAADTEATEMNPQEPSPGAQPAAEVADAAPAEMNPQEPSPGAQPAAEVAEMNPQEPSPAAQEAAP